MKEIRLFVCVAAAIMALQGCQTTGKRDEDLADNKYARLSDYNNRDEFAEMQALMQGQNIYVNTNSVVKLANKGLECPLELQAHRGDSGHIENTEEAVKVALENGFDAVEIDVQRLRNGRWAAFHDDYTGRAAVFKSGKKARITSLSSREYLSLRLRDNDGNLTSERPNSAKELIKTFSKHATAGQHLNIEVKTKSSDEELRELDEIVRKYIPEGQYSYSSMDFKTLEQLRRINKGVYLGVVQRPEATSIRILKKQVRAALKDDGSYRRNRRAADKFADYMERESNKKHVDYTSSRMLALIKSKLGSNAGLHLDVRRFNETPNVKLRARNAGLEKVATYTINGQKYHQGILNKLTSKEKGPDAAIVDDSVYHVCRRAYPYKRSSTNEGDVIGAGNNIPNDIDFQRVIDEGDYLPDNMYVKLNGEVGYINNSKKSSNDSGMATTTFAMPELAEDEDIDLTTSGPTVVKFKNK